MADTKHTSDAAAEIMNVLRGVTPEVRFAVTRLLMQDLHDDKQYPEAEFDEDEGAIVCPHCFTEMHAPQLFEFISYHRMTPVDGVDTDDRMLWYDSDYAEADGYVAVCPGCELPLRAPRGWGIDFT